MLLFSCYTFEGVLLFLLINPYCMRHILVLFSQSLSFSDSKSLRKELPINTYRDLTKSEHQEITDDLQVCVLFIMFSPTCR